MHDAPTPLTKDYPRRDRRLGRRMQLDARSLPFMIERTPPELRRPLRSVHWSRSLPVLDQGDLGACVGYAATGALATEPWDILDGVLRLSVYTAADFITQAGGYAQALYSETTRHDPFPGDWPPDDTGTDGLSVAQVLKARGVIRAYRHASTLRGFAQLLQDGPVIMGMPWLDTFYDPDGHGRIDAEGWEAGGLAGGHEVQVIGLDLYDFEPTKLEAATFQCVNSWGDSWGLLGRFTMRGATYQALRDDIDLRQLVP